MGSHHKKINNFMSKEGEVITSEIKGNYIISYYH